MIETPFQCFRSCVSVSSSSGKLVTWSSPPICQHQVSWSVHHCSFSGWRILFDLRAFCCKFTTGVACSDIGKYYSNPGYSIDLGCLKNGTCFTQHGGVLFTPVWACWAAGSSLARRWNRVLAEKEDGVTHAIEATVVSDKGMSTYHGFFPTCLVASSSWKRSNTRISRGVHHCLVVFTTNFNASSCNYIPYWMP